MKEILFSIIILTYIFIYSLFQEYKTCSDPYFINCDEDTLTEFHILDSAFTPICGHLASGKFAI